MNYQLLPQYFLELSVEELNKISIELQDLILQKKLSLIDHRLEDAIIFLANACDGARSIDKSGFNKIDARYGQWLATLIESNQRLTEYQAESALKMIQKYRKQLAKGGIDLPVSWEDISIHYQPSSQESITDDETNPFRLTFARKKIKVSFPYDQDLVAVMREIKGIYKESIFDGDTKFWFLPIASYALLMEKIDSYDFDVDSELEGAYLAYLQKVEEDAIAKQEKAEEASYQILSLIKEANLDKPLANGWHLFPHQKEAVKWLLSHLKGGIFKDGILADHMGLGKTLSALAAAKIVKERYDCTVFVICPASLKANWLIEAERVGILIEVFSWAKMPMALAHQQFLLIADEAHYAQNIKSARTQKLLGLSQSTNCLGTWLLTGTPLKNGRPVNLYPLLKAVNHPLSKNQREYERHYCSAHYESIGSKTIWDNTGASHLDELAKETENVIFRRTKKDCLDLPPKIRTKKQVELSSSETKEYNLRLKDLVADYRKRVERGEVDPAAEALVTLNYLRKLGSHYKVNGAIELAQDILEQGEQVVIFTEFVESAQSIAQELGGLLLTGETPVKHRQQMVEDFQSGENRVFVGTIKAGGVGITLTAASNILIVDRPWTPGDCEQSEDRCHRIGQNDTVTAFWLQLGVIDEKIDALLEAKGERIELVLKGKRKTLRGLDSPQELAMELLELF